MARKMIVRTGDESQHILEETEAANEEELRSLVKDNPDLLPIEEFGLNGPIMVVGRETTLPSGAVDLICVTANGDLLVVEFKTGPQNSDFRHSLAQLLHYGSDLWHMTYEVFESTVAVRYFGHAICHDPRVKGKTSLEEAVKSTWPEFSEEELSHFKDHLTRQLEHGAFNYVLVASNFTETVTRTMEYINAQGSTSDFFCVELVPFSGHHLSAFESRTIVKPYQQTGRSRSSTIDESRFLDQVIDERYQESLKQLLDLCHGLGLKTPWGSVGTSIRIPIPDTSDLLSIGWVFPPGEVGWLGLRDVTLGVDIKSASKIPSVNASINSYMSALENLDGVEPVTSQSLRAFHIGQAAMVELSMEVSDIIAELVRRVSTNND